MSQDQIRKKVRERYGDAARPENQSSCCAPGCCSTPELITNKSLQDASLQLGYSPEDLEVVPEGSNLGLGCGNPQGIASLQTGETVLDLGSGAGFDCFLAARQVGKDGKVIGVDMTPEMIHKARENARREGYENVEFRLGEIEHLPAADSSVDVIISNCVINLSPDKPQVFREAYRVLKDHGRLAISDTVAVRDMPDQIKKDLDLYSACISGAAAVDNIRNMLSDCGFTEIQIKIEEESSQFIQNWSPGDSPEDYIRSALITAVK
jgi:SAM-dependent methyltransferase